MKRPENKNAEKCASGLVVDVLHPITGWGGRGAGTGAARQWVGGGREVSPPRPSKLPEVSFGAITRKEPCPSEKN